MSRATALWERERKAVYAYQFATARSLAEQALELIARAPADQDLLAVRIRVLVTASYADTEVGEVDRGLARLDAADRLLDDLADPVLRKELHLLSREQRGFQLIRVGRTEEGLGTLDEIADELERDLAAGVGQPSVLAILHLNRSLAHIGLGATTAADAEAERCARLVAEHDLDPIIAMKARHNQGYLAYLSGDMPTALRRYEESARICADLAPSLLPVVRLDQARAMLAAGLADEAARNLDEALPVLRKQRGGQDLAEAQVARAAAALLGGDPDAAQKRARAARDGFTKRGNRRWAAIAELAAVRAQAWSVVDTRRTPPATLVARAQRLAAELGELGLSDERALALLLATRMLLRRGEVDAARALLREVPRPRSTTPVDHRMLLRLCRAELAIETGVPRRALDEARAGLQELGEVRDRMGGMELVCGTAVHGQELGELAVRHVLDRRRPDARVLFDWLERTRAQVYRYEPLPVSLPPQVAAKAAELRYTKRAVQSARLAGRPVDRLEKQSALLEREVYQSGWSAVAVGSPRPVATLARVTGALGRRALVSFATTDGELLAVVATTDHTDLLRLGDFAEAAEQAARLHADLDVLAPDTLPPPVVDVVKASAARSAAKLDDQLLRPLLPSIGDREVVVVPTGPLYAVPWGSLPSLRGRSVVVAPSATAWLTAEESPASSGGSTLLARGPHLTGQVAEDERLLAVYPGAVLMDERSATVSAVLDSLDGAALAHLAAHGEHEPTNALFSRLELADGPLFAYEVTRLRQPPRQVVLAACELALNYVRPGDEALGYAGALLAGGVRTVVAATSRVGDAAAANAMAEYHQALADGATPARALAATIAQDPYRRPFICLGAG
ncbi:hypothetical protein BJP25_26125 [Actinokineospora bangkokensis]|uniref:CHAT domain-containing protein n=1 Tax=Actinokineospora bangkokensis TaxID=1193682 RepID=A0A1Q9LI39_9PSEU|nr:hypothetical protein BJP25_26125 [Actinokineospora bangkokensis]